MDVKSEINKLWLVHKNILQLCKNRGYSSTSLKVNQTFEEFKEQFGDNPSENRPRRSDLTFIVTNIKRPTEQMIVFFFNKPQFDVKTIQEYCFKMHDESIKRGIFVVHDMPGKFERQTLLDMAPRYILEYFIESELQFDENHYRHLMNHKILSKHAQRKVLSRLNLAVYKFEKIRYLQLEARYWRLKKGQVVKVKTNSLTGQESRYKKIS